MKILKKWVKSVIAFILSRILKCSDKKLYKEVNKYKYVSFDMFDTLVCRYLINPNEVFELTEKVFIKNGYVSNGFAERRKKADTLARMHREDSEPDIYEIYSCIEGASEAEKKELLSIELRIEENICRPIENMQRLLEYCQTNNKEVFIISDMYLSKETIISILRKCGYFIDSSHIYVSCNERCSKSTGKLFDKVCTENNIDKHQYIHIGDSIKSDCLMPKKMLFHSCLYKRETHSNRGNSSINKEIDLDSRLFSEFLDSFLRRKDEHGSFFENIGYEVLGPLLAGFVMWLHKQTLKNECESLLFLARDGKILMDAYEIMYPEEKNKLRYFYISRTAAINASFHKCKSLKEIIDLLFTKEKVTVGELLDKVALSEPKRNELARLNYYDSDLISELNEIRSETLLKALISDKYEYCCEQELLLKEYLGELSDNKKIAIVDIGWEGRIQWAFDRIISDGADVYGFYLGIIRNREKLTKELKMFSYLGIMNKNDYQARVISESVGFFESMFLTNEGSTYEYRRDESGNVMAAKYDVDQIDKNMIGNICELQSSALVFVEKIKEVYATASLFEWKSDILMNNYYRVALEPTMKFLKNVKNMRFREDDVDEFGAKHSLAFYLFHPNRFRSDLIASKYRVLFLKDILKIRIPYFEFLVFAMNKLRRN